MDHFSWCLYVCVEVWWWSSFSHTFFPCRCEKTDRKPNGVCQLLVWREKEEPCVGVTLPSILDVCEKKDRLSVYSKERWLTERQRRKLMLLSSVCIIWVKLTQASWLLKISKRVQCRFSVLLQIISRLWCCRRFLPVSMITISISIVFGECHVYINWCTHTLIIHY